MKITTMACAGALLLASCASGTSVFEVAVGDCINLPDTSGDGVATFDTVECDVSHDAEIFELFDLADAEEFPGDEAISAEAEEGCLAAFEPYVGVDYNSSRFFFTYVPPSEQSWDELDDREIICLLAPAPGEPQLTVSVRGAAE